MCMIYTYIYIYIITSPLLRLLNITQAANPGAVLEDFIRWYSPRDWIDDEGVDEWGQGKGKIRKILFASLHIKFQLLFTTHSSAQYPRSREIPVIYNYTKRRSLVAANVDPR